MSLPVPSITPTKTERVEAKVIPPGLTEAKNPFVASTDHVEHGYSL